MKMRRYVMSKPTVQARVTFMAFTRRLYLGLLLAFVATFPANAAPTWTAEQAEILKGWIERAEDEAIELPQTRAIQLRAAIYAGDPETLDTVARDAALELMRAWRGQCCGDRRPRWWHIDGSMPDARLEEGLEQALFTNSLDPFLRSIRPSHPYYSALAEAYARETEPVRREVIAKNLARWRWLPAQLGERYLLVNIAAQKLSLWERGTMVLEWRVIIGKPVTRTPVFTTEVTGIVLNPWWEIPDRKSVV